MKFENKDEELQQKNFIQEDSTFFSLTPLKSDLWIKKQVKFTHKDIENSQVSDLIAHSTSFQSCLLKKTDKMNQIDCIQQKLALIAKNKHNEIMQPKPTSSYCRVCQENFTDYRKHITHPVHKKKLNQHIPTQQILELSEKIKFFQQFDDKKHHRRDSLSEKLRFAESICKRRIIQQQGVISAKSLKDLNENTESTAISQAKTHHHSKSFKIFNNNLNTSDL